MQLELFREGSMGRAECHNHNPITSNLLFCNSVPVWNVLKRICQTKLVTWIDLSYFRGASISLSNCFVFLVVNIPVNC